MKILVVSKNSWDDSNSIGNTLSNLFGGYNPEKIAHLYTRDVQPNNDVCKNYYSMHDKEIIKSIFGKTEEVGNTFTTKNTRKKTRNNNSDDKVYSFFRKKEYITPKIIQNLLWNTVTTWKNEKLKSFLHEFNPDIIFSLNYSTPFMNNVLSYIHKETGAKLVIFHTDDFLTVDKSSGYLTTLYNRYRSGLERKISQRADFNYGISMPLCTLYSNEIKEPVEILYKGQDFYNKPSYDLPNDNKKIIITFIGSILYGRWKTLAMLAKVLKRINNNSLLFELNIYSQYEPTKKMKEEMLIDGTSNFMGKLNPEDIDDTYKKSDIVLHVESFDYLDREKTKLSFSTKIVDLLNSGRTIMVIGWEEAASIDYFAKNDAALVANNENEIEAIFRKIIDDNNILKEYANKSWSCGVKNHKLETIQTNLYNDFKLLIKGD